MDTDTHDGYEVDIYRDAVPRAIGGHLIAQCASMSPISPIMHVSMFR